MTKDLKTLSVLRGSRYIFSSYSPRHLGSQVLRRKGASVSDLRATLDHLPGSTATAHYEADSTAILCPLRLKRDNRARPLSVP